MKEYEAKITFKVPEGYEWTGVIRCPKIGEFYLTRWINLRGEEVRESKFNFTEEQYPILRKAEVWKPLTLDKTMECFASQAKIKVRHASSKVAFQDEDIRDIYYSASNFLCIRARLSGEQAVRQFLPKELEYLETSK